MKRCLEDKRNLGLDLTNMSMPIGMRRRKGCPDRFPMGEGNLYSIIREVPNYLDVVLTHGHGDHAGRELKNLIDHGLKGI